MKVILNLTVFTLLLYFGLEILKGNADKEIKTILANNNIELSDKTRTEILNEIHNMELNVLTVLYDLQKKSILKKYNGLELTVNEKDNEAKEIKSLNKTVSRFNYILTVKHFLYTNIATESIIRYVVYVKFSLIAILVLFLTVFSFRVYVSKIDEDNIESKSGVSKNKKQINRNKKIKLINNF